MCYRHCGRLAYFAGPCVRHHRLLSSAPMTEQQQLEAAIAALEGQRSTLGDAVVESAARGRERQARGAHPSAAAPPSLPAQTLRQVSILFLDVVGSTALASTSTPRRSAP